jgi:hypothetical protein
MNNAEAAEIVATLHGAYPGSYFDGAVAEVFVNSLLTANFATAQATVAEWVKSIDRFPTIAELNGAMRRLRERESQERQLPRGGYEVADRATAREAFSRNYIRARTEAGESMEDITPKLERHLRAWKLHPSNGPAQPARTG